MPTLDDFRPLDYVVFCLSAAMVAVAALAALYALPWRPWCRLRRRREPYAEFWAGKVGLEALLATLGALQILRLPLLWGPNSIVAPASVTDWTGAGWLCRIYLTAGLGIAAPMVAWFALFLLKGGGSGDATHAPSPALPLLIPPKPWPPTAPYSPSLEFGPSPSRTAQRRVALAAAAAAFVTLPILLLHAAAAWVSLLLETDGEPVEAHLRSLLGFFFAAFAYGSPEQCSSDSSDTTPAPNSTAPPAPVCTECAFPASSAIIHAVWTFFFLLALRWVGATLTATALNRSLRRRLRLTVYGLGTCSIVGAVCIGASVAATPLSWPAQGCFLGYVVAVAVTAVLLTWEMVLVPVHAAHVAARASRRAAAGARLGPTFAQEVVGLAAAPAAPAAVTTPSASGPYPSHPGGRGGLYGEDTGAYCHLQLTTIPAATAASESGKNSDVPGTPRGGGGGGGGEAISARDVLEGPGEGGNAVETPGTGFSWRQGGLGGDSPAIQSMQQRWGGAAGGVGAGSVSAAQRPGSAASSVAGSVYSVGGSRGGWGFHTPAPSTARAPAPLLPQGPRPASHSRGSSAPPPLSGTAATPGSYSSFLSPYSSSSYGGGTPGGW